MRIVCEDNIQTFNGTAIGTTTDVSKDIRSQLNDCVTMARRMARASEQENKAQAK